MSLALDLDQEVTYWTVASVDKNAVKTWNPGVKVLGKFAKKTEEVTDIKGKTIMSFGVYYLNVDLDVGAYIALGDHDGQLEPKTVNVGARLTVKSASNPLFDLVKVWV